MSFYCITFEKRKNILNITLDKGNYILIISFEKLGDHIKSDEVKRLLKSIDEDYMTGFDG